jgi:peptide/nickel transport system ATP-binding protein
VVSGPLEIDDLKVEFPRAHRLVKAADGISYTVDAGETVALVSESGCGKSMSALAILGLVPEPGRVAAGRVLFEGRDLLDLPEDRVVEIRGREIALIFQEPMTSLNPVLSIGVQLREGMRRHLGLSHGERRRALATPRGRPAAVRCAAGRRVFLNMVRGASG